MNDETDDVSYEIENVIADIETRTPTRRNYYLSVDSKSDEA